MFKYLHSPYVNESSPFVRVSPINQNSAPVGLGLPLRCNPEGVGFRNNRGPTFTYGRVRDRANSQHNDQATLYSPSDSPASSLQPSRHQLTLAQYVLPKSITLPPDGVPAIGPNCYALNHGHCPWQGSKQRGKGGSEDQFQLPPHCLIRVPLPFPPLAVYEPGYFFVIARWVMSDFCCFPRILTVTLSE